MTLATTVVQKCKRGPFGGGGFLGSLRERMAHWKTINPEGDAIYTHFYPYIAADFGLLEDVKYGSREHRALVLDLALTHPAIVNVGEATKHARWFAWFRSHRSALQEGWSVLCFAPSPQSR